MYLRWAIYCGSDTPSKGSASPDIIGSRRSSLLYYVVSPSRWSLHDDYIAFRALHTVQVVSPARHLRCQRLTFRPGRGRSRNSVVQQPRTQDRALAGRHDREGRSDAMTTLDRTVLFIDLAGFTAATVTHGDDVGADLADRLVDLTKRSLGPTDVLVKSLGDAVMLVSQTPSDSLTLSGRICARADHENVFPLLRMGLHHGPVVQRSDDWFGTTVNVAARLAAMAGPGEVLTTPVVASAGVAADMPVEALGTRMLRGIPEPIDVAAVVPCPAVPDRVVDPICHMAIERSLAAETRTVADTTHYFCSSRCAKTFDTGAPPTSSPLPD